MVWVFRDYSQKRSLRKHVMFNLEKTEETQRREVFNYVKAFHI